MNINAAFQWECQPQAENFILEVVQQALEANATLRQLEQDLLQQTSTRLFDWLDYIVVPATKETSQQLKVLGFVPQEKEVSIFIHPGAQLPRIVLQKPGKITSGLALSVDSIADFLMARGGATLPIEGSLFGDFRRCQINVAQGVAFWVIERRGTLSIQPTEETPKQIYAYALALEQWLTHPRDLANEEQAMQATIACVEALIAQVGQPRAAWTVLEGERKYWQARNRAGQIQKSRQDQLGLGWANHDHHTFRSSRQHFKQLVHLFELLGFHCRERFYAGEEAGWGAQVMENPVCRLVLFLDVDLAPQEIERDIAHELLPPLDHLGTIGMWCALHGDSILRSGMHHLEAQFMFEELAEDLSQQGVQMMKPFSSFPYLKQAFTKGEMWRVDPKRLQKLVQQGLLTNEQGERFATQGALGSHLENLQRREGYKGFNQKNVSIIIKRTDPRQQQSD